MRRVNATIAKLSNPQTQIHIRMISGGIHLIVSANLIEDRFGHRQTCATDQRYLAHALREIDMGRGVTRKGVKRRSEETASAGHHSRVLYSVIFVQ